MDAASIQDVTSEALGLMAEAGHTLPTHYSHTVLHSAMGEGFSPGPAPLPEDDF